MATTKKNKKKINKSNLWSLFNHEVSGDEDKT